MKKVLIEEPFRVSVKRDAQIPTPKERLTIKSQAPKQNFREEF